MTPAEINETLDAEFTCNHETVHLVRFICSNGTYQWRDQCARCGVQIGNHKKAASIPWQKRRDAPMWDANLREKFFGERKSREDELWGRTPYVARTYFDRAFYDGYLLTDRWQEIRQLIFKRCGGICEGCGVRKATEVHHMDYDHLGNELLFRLLGLCGDCHDKAGNPPADRPPCDYCEGAGMVVAFRRPPVPRRTPATASAYCVCPHGRWMRQQVARTDPATFRRMLDLKNILQDASRWSIEPFDETDDPVADGEATNGKDHRLARIRNMTTESGEPPF